MFINFVFLDEQFSIVAGVTWIGYEIYDAFSPDDEIEPYYNPPPPPPDVVLSEKTLNDLVPGSLKRQKNWDDGYASKTPEQIDNLAKMVIGLLRQ